jgi:uncharacterized protein YjeT (DUF2065 family)
MKQDTNNSKPKNQELEPESLEFTVMPHREPLQKPSKQKPKTPMPGRRSLWIWVGSAFLILVIAGLGYWAYVVFFKKNINESANLPETNLNLPQSETQDSDSDGLTDKLEQEKATNPHNPDTDGDGLADGDEVNIYGSDPMLSDTDNDGFDDGREVARGYSPTRAESVKATAEEIQVWSEKIAERGLHEPTEMTLKLKAEIVEEGPKNTYANDVLGYSLELPAVLTYRESSDKTQVGIYVVGTTPDSPDFQTDPIFINLAVQVGEQSLSEWADAQFGAGQYDSKEVIKIDSGSALKLLEVRLTEAVCAQDKALFAKKGKVVMITLTCNESPALQELFNDIIATFKYAP